MFNRFGVGRSSADDELGDGRVAVLSDGLWRQRLGADPNIVGSSLELNGEPHTVIGVLPPGFNVPSPWYVNQMHDIYVPFDREEITRGRDSHWLLTLGQARTGRQLGDG